MCHFHLGTYRCSGNGYCRNAESAQQDGQDRSTPCPACNTDEWLRQQKSRAESTEFFFGMNAGSGVTLWENAVSIAELENSAEAHAILAKIGVVRPVIGVSEGVITTRTFCYCGVSGNPIAMRA